MGKMPNYKIKGVELNKAKIIHKFKTKQRVATELITELIS